MNAMFIDCTPELKRVLQDKRLPIPEWLRICEGSPSEALLGQLCSDAELLLVEHTSISADMLSSWPHLKGIVFMGTGAGSYVPLDVAKRLGIAVSTVPGYANRAVAEHAMALLFASARQIARMDREVRAGAWNPLGGLQLRDRKVAVIGLGGIGEEFAAMAQALGMRVMAWNRTPSDLPYYVRDIDTALENADVVSLHLALNSETSGLISAERLQLLAHGAIVINTARAQLVDEAALLAALANGKVGHAGLDVFSLEPLTQPNVWEALDNVTLSAHAAYMTDEAYAQLWRSTIERADMLRSSIK